MASNIVWGHGSVGRAMRSQRIGQGFDSPCLHHNSGLHNRAARYLY